MHAEEHTNDQQMHSIVWDQYMRAGQQALRLKNIQEAERMFSLAYERSQSFNGADLRQLETLRLIVKCYIDRGDIYKAEEFLNPLMEELFNRFGAESPELLNAMLLLADIHHRQAKYTDGTSLLRYVLDHHPQKHIGTRDPEFAEIQRRFEEMRTQTRSEHEQDLYWLN